MGRRKKDGMDYAAWDVDVFDDPKIMRLIGNEGSAGFLVFFAVCQRIYASSGYYIKWDEWDAPWVKRMICGEIEIAVVERVVERCLELHLFDPDVFRRCGVLTSRAIQRNFSLVLPKRRRKEVRADVWLLPPEESGGAVLVSDLL